MKAMNKQEKKQYNNTIKELMVAEVKAIPYVKLNKVELWAKVEYFDNKAQFHRIKAKEYQRKAYRARKIAKGENNE